MALARTLHDVVICGGGVVGTLLGCLLAESPRLSRLSLGLVEPSPARGLAAHAAAGRVGGRTYALSPASARLLASAGVWDAIVATGRAPAYTGMRVWDALGPGSVAFGAAPGSAAAAAAPALGYMVEHEVLAGALWERLQAHRASGRVAVYTGARMAALELPPSPLEAAWPGWGAPPPAAGAGAGLATLCLSDAQTLTARLLVAADGAASPARAAAGLGVAALDYAQHAVCATVELSAAEGEGARGTAWQRFLPLGPIAVLPLWGRAASIVWTTSPAHAAALLAMPPADFVAALNAVLHAPQAAFHAAMGTRAPLHNSNCHAPGAAAPPPPPPRAAALLAPPTAFPLRLQLAQAYTRPRFALLGDAAHTIHPLAGQGLNQGCADAADLQAVLSARVGGLGEECGSSSVLEDYAARAGPRNLGVALGVHALQRLFAGQGVGGPLEALLPPGVAACIWGPGGALPALRTLGLGLANTSVLAQAFAGMAGAPGGVIAKR